MPNACSKNFAVASGSRTEMAMWRSLLAMAGSWCVRARPIWPPGRCRVNCPAVAARGWNAGGAQRIVAAGNLIGMRTQVGIIGAGPAGLFLSHLLYREGIDCIVLEARSREHIEGRVRAGVLEQGTVELMRELGLDARLRRDAMIDNALDIRFGDGLIHLDLPALTGGKCATIYGQQEVVKDLVAARLADGAPLVFEAEAVALDSTEGTPPAVRYPVDGPPHT